MNDALLDSLRRAVEAAPDDVTLRVHLGELLVASGRHAEAIQVIGFVLQVSPEDTQARDIMSRALGAGGSTPGASRAVEARDVETGDAEHDPDDAQPQHEREARDADEAPDFDWGAAEQQVEDVALPTFVGDEVADDDQPQFDTQAPTVTLDDVGGMQSVKDRLDAAFLAPLRNPELRKLYAKSLRGGLLMYGPPGCGKTFLARAVAGELGAGFISIGLADILDPYLGNSEQNVHAAFQYARQNAPCVLFFDEVDTLGQRRSQTRNSAIRGTVNQMLTELDGVDGLNEGVFVLAATNQPWDVDPAMRRPGRFDRTVLVLPPDRIAREAIFRTHLRSRPVEGIDLGALAKKSELFSGADIAYVCELAAERALLDSVRTGEPRLMGMADLLGALDEVKPSTLPWLDSARNAVAFGNDDGTYSELAAYLRQVKRL